MTEKPNWEKLTQSVVRYTVPSPEEDERCSNCSMYIAPEGGSRARCTDVAGPIFANGWCKIWDKK